MHPSVLAAFAVALAIAVVSCAFGRGLRAALARLQVLNRTAGTMLIGSGVTVAVR